MTRDEYKTSLLGNGFVFEKTQPGYPGRGDEDVYTHPSYKYKFYVSRVRKGDESLYGFMTGERNGADLDRIYPHNTVDDFRDDKQLPVWLDNAFTGLLSHL